MRQRFREEEEKKKANLIKELIIKAQQDVIIIKELTVSEKLHEEAKRLKKTF